VQTTDSVIHVAASLNRKSEKACLNVNLRGTLEVLKLAMASRDLHGLRRYSHVSTVAVAGQRSNEVVEEDNAIDWERSDYDPYARTKKFCEHMIRQLLHDVPRTIFRPSIVLGDSRRPETTQFEMVRAFVFLAGLPLLPLRAGTRWTSCRWTSSPTPSPPPPEEKPAHDIYHLSSGAGSQTYEELTNALADAQRHAAGLRPALEPPFTWIVERLSSWRGSSIGYGASLLKVFLPYLVWNTVFDNTRVVAELGRTPAPFSRYAYGLLKFSQDHNFSYPYRAWPAE
jgi:nucleoside-diphosphate-sugar epimerase